MKMIPTLQEKDFLSFYNQSGGAIPIFIAKRQRQYGSGLGNFLVKSVLPFLGKTVKHTVLPAALSAAQNALSDIRKGKNTKATLKKRGLQVGTQIARNILGTRSTDTDPPPLKRRRVIKKNTTKKKKKKKL